MRALVMGGGLVAFGGGVAGAAPHAETVTHPVPRGQLIEIQRPARPAAAVSSRLIFMHRCPPSGCSVRVGEDNSSTDTSSIAEGNRSIGPFTQSEAVWLELMQCMRDTYAPFDITITDVDPGDTPHFENIVGGVASDLRSDIANAGGVAPFACTSGGQGAEIPNAMVFTFDVYGPSALSLCWTSAQEVAHAFGLDHSTFKKDPMTYLSGELPKRFQPRDAGCGELETRSCKCTGSPTQNTYQHIVTMFGPGVPTAPTLAILSPAEGTRVQPRFIVQVEASDDVAVDRVELVVDGQATGVVATLAPYRLVAPDTFAEGPHVVEVRAYDIQGTPATSQITVELGPPCTAATGCEGNDVCVDGVCLGGPNVPGGLGDTCTERTECLSGNCLEDASGAEYCVEACAGAGTCPNGFECLADANVCWPAADAGCCSTGGSPTAPALLGFGVLAVALRRRRR